MIFISDTPTIKYWKILGNIIDKAKQKIPKECRISDTCFTSFATIGGNLFTIKSKNINHVNGDSENLLSVIIILRTDVDGEETFIYYGYIMNYIE